MATRGRPRLTPELKLRALMKRKEKQKLYEHESKILRVSSQVKIRWESVKRLESLKTNNEVANYLLDLWEKTRSNKLLEVPMKWSETSQFTSCIAEPPLESSNPVSGTPESNEGMTESSVEIKVENFENDVDVTSNLSEDSETEEEINEIVNHAKGLNCRIKLTDEDTENITSNEKRRKSSRVQTRGFRPNYASLDWVDRSNSDSENIKDNLNNIKQNETEDHQNKKTVGNFFKDFSERVENALSEKMRNVSNWKKIYKEKDPDFIVSDDDAKDLSDSEESININHSDSCDDGTPKSVQNENPGKIEINASKQKPYRKRKRKIKAVTESAKKPWIHIKLQDHQEKYRIETVGNFERKNRNSNLTEELYTCLLCGRFKSTAKDIFEEHVEKHVNMVLQCDQCNYVGRSEIEIMRHKANTGHMRKGSEYMCDICGVVLYTWDSRLSHMGKVHDDPQFKCKFCEEKYVTRIKRQQHMRAIHADIIQYCNICKTDQQTLSQEEFRKHQENCKPGHQCQVCGVVLASKSGVTNHLKFTHMGVRKYQCQLCQYAGKSKQRLREHVMTHNSVHPYSCDKCPFTCVQAYQLKSHMRTHSGEKPFKCTQCKFAAAWNVQLKYHMSVHELESSIMCQQCDVLFKNEKALKMHEKKDHSAIKNTSV